MIKPSKDYDKALSLEPELIQTFISRGVAYAKQGLYDRAISDYDKAIALNPGFAQAYYNRGYGSAYDRAISDYDKAHQT